MANTTPVKKTKTSAKNTAKKAVIEKAPIKTKPTNTKEILSPKVIFNTWLDGWKKALVFKGRSSRFELWIFLLVNSFLTSIIHIGCYYIASSSYLRLAYAHNYSIETIETHIIAARMFFYAIMVISCLPAIAILVRRIHDIGHLAWKKYLEPASMSIVSMWIMFLAAIYIEDMSYSNDLTTLITIVAIFVYLFFILSLYASGYYLLKFLIITLFYQGKEELNTYGKAPVYNTPYYENIALTCSCIYFLFISTMSIIQTFLFLI